MTNDESGAVALIAVLSVVLVFVGIAAGTYPDEDSKRMRKIILSACLSLGVTGFLWMPWAGYGIRTLYTWNMGKVHDLEPETKVLEPAPRERPSAADQPPEASPQSERTKL